MRTYFMIAGAALACGIVIAVLRRPGFFKRFAGSSAVGLVSLAILNLTAPYTGVGLAVSGWTMAAAGLLGLPGVASMLALKAVWGI